MIEFSEINPINPSASASALAGHTMKAPVSADWTCPLCDTAIPFDLNVKSKGRRTLTVTLGDAALADVFAHAWTHFEEPA